MPDYAGYWLECHNRNCGFPIRVPYSSRTAKDHRGSPAPAPFLFACPVCLQVNAYRKKDLQRVQFRTPNPYKAGKLVLYSACLGCARRGCRSEIVVFTVAAANVSTAVLTQLWRSWKVNFRCGKKHRFGMPDPKNWWVQEEKSLAGDGCRPSGVSII